VVEEVVAPVAVLVFEEPVVLVAVLEESVDEESVAVVWALESVVVAVESVVDEASDETTEVADAVLDAAVPRLGSAVAPMSWNCVL